MADDLVDHVRLWRVERSRMMPNILRAKKDAVGKIFQKDPRLDQTGNWLQTKAADRQNLLIDFAQLRNASGRKVQLLQTLEVFRARMLPVRRLQRSPDREPDLMLLIRIRSIRNGIAGVIVHRDL